MERTDNYVMDIDGQSVYVETKMYNGNKKRFTPYLKVFVRS